MAGRDINQQHRGSSPLELLFDLTSVVAVAAVASRLHHNITTEHYVGAAVDFVFSFFTVWISWMNFSWFSSAYDTDDISYRLAAIVQMAGMLIMAAGLANGAGGQLTATLGYTVTRLSLIWLWRRAGREHPERRTTCRRYARGLLVLQTLWIARVVAVSSDWMLPLFFVLVSLELSLPISADSAGETPWNPHHIADRYSLFTVILLGECMAGSTTTMRAVLQTQGLSLDFVVVSFSLVGLVGGLWWAYFLAPFAQALHLRRKRSALWGYGHMPLFFPLFVISGMLQVVSTAFEQTASKSGISPHESVLPLLALSLTSAMTVAFLAALRWLAIQTTHRQPLPPLSLLSSMLLATIAVAVVASGFPLCVGLALLALSPVVFVAIVMRWRHLQPERFAIR